MTPSLAGVRKSISKIRILVLKKYNIVKTLSIIFFGNIFGKNITIYTLYTCFMQSNNENFFLWRETKGEENLEIASPDGYKEGFSGKDERTGFGKGERAAECEAGPRRAGH